MRVHRRLTAVLAGWAAIAMVTTVRAEEPSTAEGPVCLWQFDGTLEDRAGKTADALATRQGQARFVDASQLPGVIGKAVALGVQQGDAEYLVASVSEEVAPGPDYSIEAWIYPTELSTWNRLALRWGGAPDYAYHLALHHGTVSLCHNQSSGEYLFAEGGRVAAKRWHHLAAVARRNDRRPSESTLTVYLDGRVAGTAPFDGTIKDLAAEDLGIGDSAGAPSAASRYRGYLDELAIWDRALEPTEIAAHYARRADVLAKLQVAERRQETARRAELFARLSRYGCQEIVFAEREAGRDPSGHYYANFGYSCIDPSYWIHGADGGSLCKLDVRTGELTRLVDDPLGAVRDPQVHYDAQKILFSYRRGGTHHYNLYEIDIDGGRLRRITTGRWDDVEPAYLPDGHIMFCSTRCNRYIGCWLAPSAVLHRCDAAGGNIRMVSSGSFTENTPSVLPDGRVLYTRWEYVNRDPVSFHHLWTINPDGSGQMVYFGNMHLGGVFIDAKPIPGSDGIVLIHSPGHGRNEHAGHVAVADAKHGPDVKSAMRSVSRSADFRDPYPLSPDAFLVARGNQILLMDDQGATEVVYTGERMVHEPWPILPRPREKLVSPHVDLAKGTATLVLRDVYFGRRMQDVPRGTIRRRSSGSSAPCRWNRTDRPISRCPPCGASTSPPWTKTTFRSSRCGASSRSSRARRPAAWAATSRARRLPATTGNCWR